MAAGTWKPTINNTTSLVLDRNHPFSDLYYKKARNKVYWGGRGAAKSWAFAEALIRLTASTPLRVLCCREFQSSIRESSHRILKDTITRLGLDAWFVVTNESIRSKVGSEFFFKGLYNNENGIRSTEGIDIVWVEEAHSVSVLSWRSLGPTVRKPGSEIWVSFNYVDDDNATYGRFVESPPAVLGSTLCVGKRPNSIVHKVNYDSNPFFGGELAEEMETDKATDYDVYEHVWLGLPLKINNEVIFAGKYRVAAFEDDLWKNAERRFRGLDFGFARDPNALISFFPLEADKWWAKDDKRRLFIDYEAYDVGIELDDMPRWLDDHIPEVREWPIHADPARPETISYLRRQGFPVSAAEKWEGCVKDGITHLKAFHEIVIHPRCPHMAQEARLYRYKVDKRSLDEKGNPRVLPVIIDANNHAWDGIRYGFDGYIQRGGELGLWARLGQ